MSEWISVDSRLPDMREIYKDSPRESAWVLIFNGHYIWWGKYGETYAKRIPRWVTFGERFIKVTHWMELPKEPK